jgi:hypothetical protein
MKKQIMILTLSSLALLTGCKMASSTSSVTSMSAEEGTAKLQKALAAVPDTKAFGVEMSNLFTDCTAYSTASSSASSSATTSASSTDPVEITHFKASNGTIKAAITGLDATSVANLQGQASFAFDEVNYGINLSGISDSYDAVGVSANAYLANGNGYFDLESKAASELAAHWLADAASIIASIGKGSSSTSGEILKTPSYADSTSESFSPVKVGYKGLLSDKDLPLWNSKNSENYAEYLSKTSAFILANNDVFSFTYDAAGNGVMAVTFTKTSLKNLLAEIVADSEAESASSSVSSSVSSIDLTPYNEAIDAMTLTELSGKITFSDTAILSASWSVDVSLPENSAVAGSASIKLSGAAAFHYGSDVSVTLPSDLASYNLLG